MIWNKEMECADRETMRAVQLERLQATVKYEYENVPYYAAKMDKAGVRPEDIQTLEDMVRPESRRSSATPRETWMTGRKP